MEIVVETKLKSSGNTIRNGLTILWDCTLNCLSLLQLREGISSSWIFQSLKKFRFADVPFVCRLVTLFLFQSRWNNFIIEITSDRTVLIKTICILDFRTILNFLEVSSFFFFFFKFLLLFSKFYFSIHLKYFFPLTIYFFFYFLSCGICFVSQDERLKNVSCICLCEREKYFKNFFTSSEKKFLWIFNYSIKNFIYLILVCKKFHYETTKFCFYVNILKILLECTSFEIEPVEISQKRIKAIRIL